MTDNPQLVNHDVAWEAAHLTNRDIDRRKLHGQSAQQYSNLVGDIAVEAAEKIVKAEKIGDTDLLTGLPNRRAILKRLKQELSAAKRYGKKLSIAFFDIDGFKQVNEAGGHDFGDFILKGLAKRMKQGVRAEDFLGRHGGDEFIMILPESDEFSALVAAERVLKKLNIEPTHGFKSFRLGGSFGIVTSDGKDKNSTLITEADRLMKKAKLKSRSIRRQEAILGCITVGNTITTYNRAGESISEEQFSN